MWHLKRTIFHRLKQIKATFTGRIGIVARWDLGCYTNNGDPVCRGSEVNIGTTCAEFFIRLINWRDVVICI